jgi:hypothetical protein
MGVLPNIVVLDGSTSCLAGPLYVALYQTEVPQLLYAYSMPWKHVLKSPYMGMDASVTLL